jgi:hypothetical protein
VVSARGYVVTVRDSGRSGCSQVGEYASEYVVNVCVGNDDVLGGWDVKRCGTIVCDCCLQCDVDRFV